MITEDKNPQPNSLKCNSTWKQVEIQPMADLQLPAELLYNESTTKWIPLEGKCAILKQKLLFENGTENIKLQ